MLPQIDASGNARQHGRHMDRLSGHPRQIRRSDREQRLGEGILRPPDDAHDAPRDQNANERADGCIDEEADDRLAEAEHAGDGSNDRGPVQHERGRVIDEALALENDDDPSRYGKP